MTDTATVTADFARAWVWRSEPAKRRNRAPMKRAHNRAVRRATKQGRSLRPLSGWEVC